MTRQLIPQGIAGTSCSRRAVLRGLGVSMALPWLESYRPRAVAAAEGFEAGPPTRLAVLFAGNGFHSREWWAEGSGAEMKLGRVLEPLAGFRDQFLLVKGISTALRPATCFLVLRWPAVARFVPARVSIR